MGDGALCNVGSGVSTSLASLRSIIAAQLGVDRAPVFASWPDGEVQASLLNVRRARDVLAWEPWTTLDDGVAQLVDAVIAEETDAT